MRGIGKHQSFFLLLKSHYCVCELIRMTDKKQNHVFRHRAILLKSGAVDFLNEIPMEVLQIINLFVRLRVCRYEITHKLCAKYCGSAGIVCRSYLHKVKSNHIRRKRGNHSPYIARC